MGQRKYAMTINISDEARMATLKTILGYESAVRGLTIGQTFARLVLEAADVDSYPAEIQKQLGNIEAEQRVTAARYTLEAAGDVAELPASA